MDISQLNINGQLYSIKDTVGRNLIANGVHYIGISTTAALMDHYTGDVTDRGYAAMALELDWGPVGEVFSVEAEDFQLNSTKIFGYEYTSEKLKGLRDLFKNLNTVFNIANHC